MAIGDGVKGLQHLGLPTKDIDATIAFFESLGFTNAFSTVNNGDRVTFLQLGSVMVETYESASTTGAPGAWDHVALNVEDIEATYKQITGAGRYRVLEDGIQFLPFWDNGVRYFTIQGPNGEKVEFGQYL